MTDSGNALDLLKEEMENDECYLRVNAIHKLKIVASLMNPDQVKTVLLPYIEQLIKKEDDEILFALAEEISNLAQFIQGSLTILLPYLETLAAVEETVVRDMAVKSLNDISGKLNDQEIQNNYLPIIFRLASNEINFTCRQSAINLMYPIYKRAGAQKDKIKQKFSELCNEETSMVRRTIASKIGEFAKVMEKEYVSNDLILLFKQLSGDDQDSVRNLCLESLKQIAKIFTKDENKTHTLPVIIAATEDKSWKVRLSLAKNFAGLAESFGKEITDMSLIQIFTNLLRDNENDVKLAAIQSLQFFLKNISNDKLLLLIPHIQFLAKEGTVQVKAAVAEVLAGMFGLLGKDLSNQKLLPYLIDLFSNDNIEIKINALKATTKFVEVAGPDSFNQMLQHYKNASQESKWRIRIQVLDEIVELSQFFNSLELFQKYLEPLFFTYLKDKTAVIRDQGIQKLKVLVQQYKLDWLNSTVMPKLNENLNKDQGYLYRITALYSLQSIAYSVPQDFYIDKLLPIVTKYAKDTVPNIKFVVCKILKSFSTLNFPEKGVKIIKQTLQDLTNDSDKDVKYYAQDAFSAYP